MGKTDERKTEQSCGTGDSCGTGHSSRTDRGGNADSGNTMERCGAAGQCCGASSSAETVEVTERNIEMVCAVLKIINKGHDVMIKGSKNGDPRVMDLTVSTVPY